jgi:hypothetical protein
VSETAFFHRFARSSTFITTQIHSVLSVIVTNRLVASNNIHVRTEEMVFFFSVPNLGGFYCYYIFRNE